MQFIDELERLETELTLAGHVVLAPAPVDLSRSLDAEDLARLGRVRPPGSRHRAPVFAIIAL